MADDDDDDLYARVVASVMQQTKANAAKSSDLPTDGADSTSQPANSRSSRSKTVSSSSSHPNTASAVVNIGDDDDIEVLDDGFSGGAGAAAGGKGKKGHGKRARPSDERDTDDIEIEDGEEGVGGGRASGRGARGGAGQKPGATKKAKDEFAEFERFLTEDTGASSKAPAELTDKEAKRLASAAGLRALASSAAGGGSGASAGGQSETQKKLTEMALQQAADEERRKQNDDLRKRAIAGDDEAIKILDQRRQERQARAGSSAGGASAAAGGGAGGGGGKDLGVVIEIKVQEDTKKTGRESKLFTMRWKEPFTVLLEQYRAVHGIAAGSTEAKSMRFLTPEGESMEAQQTPETLFDMTYADTDSGKPRFFLERSSK